MTQKQYGISRNHVLMKARIEDN